MLKISADDKQIMKNYPACKELKPCLLFISTRPHTAVPPDERVNSPQRQPQSPLATREPLTSTRDQSESSDTKNEILDLIYHHSDFTVSSIIDNPKVSQTENMRCF